MFSFMPCMDLSSTHGVHQVFVIDGRISVSRAASIIAIPRERYKQRLAISGRTSPRWGDA